MSRLDAANESIKFLEPSAFISRRKGGFYVTWGRCPIVTRRWSTRSGFYPPWSRKWPGGGTSITALAQLLRWNQGRTVLPLSTWRYWGSERVWLFGEHARQAVNALAAAGYPDTPVCVLCNRWLSGHGFDWWDLDGKEGPCCRWDEGCRQQHG